MTKAQDAALKWLTDHNGDGAFDKHGVVIAAGERAPIERKTWNALADAGKVEFYGGKRDGLTGYGRIRIVK
jgi:hypothetical protein